MVPVIVDGQARDQVWAFPREERKDFVVEADPVFKILSEFLRPDIEARLEKKKNAQGVVSLRDLEGVGLSVEYSEQSLEIKIDIPMKYRKNSDLNLYFDEAGEKTYQRPTSPSGYLNLRANQSYQYGDNTASDAKLPLTGRADLVENIHGLVFQSGAEYTENTTAPWKRQDTNLTWDSEENMLRLTAGDINTMPRGFQASATIGGLSATREFAIQPYRTARPLGNSELIIKRPSLVEIYINGALYTQIRLNPGRFNIRDFPIVNGQNDVKVKIKDDLGQEETFNFSVLFENTILLQGLNEFGYYAGRPWRESGGDRAYDPDRTLTSFYHRYGFTDYLTGGVNYQSFDTQSMAGVELSAISPLGFISFDGAYSRSSQEQHGYGERLKYRSLDRILGYESKTILDLELEKRDLGFAPVAVIPLGQSNYESRVDAQLTRQFSDFFFAGLGGTYEKGGTLPADTRIYRANAIFPLTSRFRLEGTYSQTIDNTRNDSFLVSLFWIDTPGIHSVSSYYNSQNSSTNVTVSRNNIKRYDDYRLSASYDNTGGVKTTDLNADYFAQPADFRVENYSSRSDQRNFNVASVGINTAIAWVGTEFALTQPITDSFALISGDHLPKNQVLTINPNGEQADAQLGPLESTVLNQYTSYYKYTVNLDSTSLPMGYLLGKEFYYIQPTYKSGILIPVKLISKVMVKGRLYTPDRKPVSLVVGDIFNGKGELVDNTFFTNKDGVFVIEGLEPGDYYIKTDRRHLGSIPLHVRTNEKNFLVIDSLVAPAAENGDSL